MVNKRGLVKWGKGVIPCDLKIDLDYPFLRTHTVSLSTATAQLRHRREAAVALL